MIPLHTPQELVEISNAAHVAEGIILIIFAVLLAAQGLGYLKKTWQRYLVPGVALLASLTLVGFLFFDHLNELPEAWHWVTTDMQQQQHLLIGVILGLASITALIGLKLKLKLLKLALPLAFVAIGVVFLIHPQHGSDSDAARALLIHRVAGTSLVIAGLTYVASLFSKMPRKTLSIIASVALLLSAGLFISYREPLMPSDDMGGMNMSGNTPQSHHTYQLDLTSKNTYQPNQPTELVFEIRNENNEILKDFDTVHEKQLHLIVVRKDRTNFQHLHPTFDKSSGTFTLTGLQFPTDGEYRIFADFTPSDAQKDDMGMKLSVTPYKDVSVGSGTYTPQALGEDKLESSVNGLDTSLSLLGDDSPNPVPYAGMPLPMGVNINKNGKAYKNLQPYLGALGHMVVLGPNLEYVHAHTSEDTTNQNGLIIFTVDFPDPGQYKVYLQTQADGQVNTTDYIYSVKALPGSKSDSNDSDSMPSMDHSGH